MDNSTPFILSFEKVEHCNGCKFCTKGHCFLLSKIIDVNIRDENCPIIDEIGKYIVSRKAENYG